jgi:quercetin dioxygenase-like cupin family protein
MGYKPSPRPTYEGPTVIRADEAVRHVWGDEEAGFVDDWIYVSSSRLHAIVFGLPPGGSFRHSESFRTVFAADELLHVLQGTLVLANPENGEVVRAERGESVFFGRDTWHHGFSFGSDDLRVLELFAPPPSTGSSGAYAQTRPYLTESSYAPPASEEVVVGAPGPQTLRLLRTGDARWQLDRGILVGLLASTEHLTAGTIRVMPGQQSVDESHDGDELVYVLSGSLHVDAGDVAAELGPGDAFYVPAGVSHRYACAGDELCDAVFGVAPRY